MMYQAIRVAGTHDAYGASIIYRAMEDMGIQLHPPKATGGETYKDGDLWQKSAAACQARVLSH
jgi:hypothetical protein